MKITADDSLTVVGCLFCGYSFFQLLGLITRGFPAHRIGAILLFLLGMFLIVALGFTNWCGLWLQHRGVLSKDQTIVGYAPSIVFGFFAVLALIIGINVGW
ncbi:MAG: hypothetical protein ACKPER_17835 [Dolichospermum sp.]